MADIRVKTKNGRELAADSYTYVRCDGTVILRFYNPASCDDVISSVENCDFGVFDLTAGYPGGHRRELRLAGYEAADCMVTHKPAGTMLEIYLRKREVV